MATLGTKVFNAVAGWTLALARLLMQVSKVLGECKSSITRQTTRLFAEYHFCCQ